MTHKGDVETASAVDLHEAWIASARAEVRAVAGLDPAKARGRQNAPSETGIREVLASSMSGYELGETIHRGGQGVVFKAIQKATRRVVAIKALRSGPAAGEQEMARFEREVQILAQLRHPNLVTVLDSGEAAGVHYFVMDYVPGWPLDEFVGRTAPTVEKRIELFATICDAINVAHLRGIIHRDLKPGNIRVDPSAQPRVLDFGLAKVGEYDDLAASRDELRTVTGQFVGSLPWAAPEQITGRREDVELSTDVYALGVLLYQCLAGRFPYDVFGSFRDAIENICSAEPRRPSALVRALDDELDHILLKCLRKEPEARYQSAGELSRELRRYLAGEPIEAKADSSWYLLRKTIRRHRVSATIGALVAILIVTVAVGLGLMYRQERASALRERDLRNAAENSRAFAVEAQRQSERQARVKAAVNEFFSFEVMGAAAPDRLGRDVKLLDAMKSAEDSIDEQFREDPVTGGEVHFAMGTTYFRLGELDRAIEHLQASVAQFASALGGQHASTMHTKNELARVCESAGRFPEAEALFRECLSYWEDTRGAKDIETLRLKNNLGWLLARMGQWDDAQNLVKAAYEGSAATAGPDHELTLGAMNNLGLIYLETEQFEKAEPLIRGEYEASLRLLGPDDPGTLVSMGNMALAYQRMGKLDEAEEMMRQSTAARQRVLGPAHPSTILQMNNLANLYGRRQKNAEAIALMEEALRAGREPLGAEHPTIVAIESNLATLYDRTGRHGEAESLHRRAVEGARSYLPEEHELIGLYVARLGRCLVRQEKWSDAEPLLLEGHRLLEAAGNDEQARETADALTELYQHLGREVDASAWRMKGSQAASIGEPS